ncbi:hypothetical protein [Paenibacillus glycanilyticus]|uniref:hypothetical protein n=1 Tax=Paenibacillus glycanilyticus TaxID=126569 RepID=UPI000FD7E4E5|nr:hypothetical protein [Paenibacillus glycanilyticus]
MQDWLRFLPVIELLLIGFVVYSIVRAAIRYRKSAQGHDSLESIRAVLESKLGKGLLLEIVMAEINVLYFSVVVWFRKPEERQGVFSYHKTSQIKTFIIVFSILILAEGLFVHFLLAQWNKAAAWIFTILNLYALLYMTGLYNSVRFKPHRLKEGSLKIRLGFQYDAATELSNIMTVKKATDRGLGIPKDTCYALLKIDSPQVELTLKEPVLMKASYGRSKYVTTIIFRADEPGRMMEEIKSKMDR